MNFDPTRGEAGHERGGPVIFDDLLVRSHPPHISTFCANFKHKSSLDVRLSARQRSTMTVGRRIKSAREAKRRSQGWLADQIGKSQTTISSWERNRTEPTRDEVAKVADALGISLAEIELADGGATERTIPVVGYVGAASEYFGFDDHEQGAGLDEIDAPPGVPEKAVAVIVRGDSGYPAIRDGMILIYWNCMPDPSDIEGEDCFVKLRDGRTLVKIMERGTEPGRWTLVSINASTPPIRNVEVEWAAPIEIRLRRRNWKSAL